MLRQARALRFVSDAKRRSQTPPGVVARLCRAVCGRVLRQAPCAEFHRATFATWRLRVMRQARALRPLSGKLAMTDRFPSLVAARAAWSALADSSATLALTVAARACPVPELGWRDPQAEHVMRACPLSAAQLCADPALVRGIIVRSQCFDQAVRAADLRAGSQLLTLGAGLCTRRARLAAELDAAVGWFYVDLPAVMAVRRLCLPAQDGEHDWAGSLQDTRWLHAARLCADAPHVLVLEGVLPYLPADAVRALLAAIAGHFVRHGLRGQLLADFLHPAMAVPSVQGGVHLPVQSGACDAAELIAGCPGLRVLAEQHPFAEFSLGHRQFAEDFLARHQRPPYTLATLALGEPDA